MGIQLPDGRGGGVRVWIAVGGFLATTKSLHRGKHAGDQDARVRATLSGTEGR